jgi:hypothetical protein
VGPLAMTRVGLERALALHEIPSERRLRLARARARENELSIVANAFGTCQSKSFVLQSASFKQFLVLVSASPANRMAIWSVPKVFHTCGKSCGKSTEFNDLLGFWAYFPQVSTGRKLESRIKTTRRTGPNH